jgi:chromosome segregation ATPase
MTEDVEIPQLPSVSTSQVIDWGVKISVPILVVAITLSTGFLWELFSSYNVLDKRLSVAEANMYTVKDAKNDHESQKKEASENTRSIVAMISKLEDSVNELRRQNATGSVPQWLREDIESLREEFKNVSLEIRTMREDVIKLKNQYNVK